MSTSDSQADVHDQLRVVIGERWSVVRAGTSAHPHDPSALELSPEDVAIEQKRRFGLSLEVQVCADSAHW